MSSYEDKGSSRRSVTASANWPASEDYGDPLPHFRRDPYPRNLLIRSDAAIVTSGVVLSIAYRLIALSRSPVACRDVWWR